MTTFSQDGVDILAGLTRTGGRYTDSTDTILDAANLTAERGILETPEIGMRSGASAVFEDVQINQTDLGTGTNAAGIISGSSLVFRRCYIVLAGSSMEVVWAGGNTTVNATTIVPMTFEDCFIDAPAGRSAVFNARQWRVTFIRTRVSNRVLLQLPFGTPLSGLTISASRDESGRLGGTARNGATLTYSARVVNNFTGLNPRWMPLFEFRDNSGTPAGLNFNFSNTGTLTFYNPQLDPTTTPIEDVTLSIRNTFSGNSTSRFSQLYYPTLVDDTGRAITGDTEFITPIGTLWHLVPPTYNENTAIPTITTAGTSTRTITFNGTQPMGFHNNTVSLTSSQSSNATMAISTYNTALVPVQLKPSRHGFRRFIEDGSRVTVTANETDGTRYAQNGAIVLPTENSPTVTLRNSFYDSATITTTRLGEITAGGAVNNPDEVYAYSDKLNEAEDFCPWEVDTEATVTAGTPVTGRQANTNAPTQGTWWRLKPGIGLTFTNTGEYTETISVSGEGAFTGTISIPISSAWALVAGGRPIRLDGGRQATFTGVTADQAGLDSVLIDDYEDIPAIEGNSTLIYPTDTVDAGLAWRISVGTTEVASGVGQTASPTLVDYNTYNSIINVPAVIEYTTRDSLTNVRRTLAPARQVGQDVSLTVPIDGLQVAPRVPTTALTALTIDITTTGLTQNRVDIDVTGIVPGGSGSLNVSGATASIADAKATVDYLQALDRLIRARSLVSLFEAGTDTADFIYVEEGGAEFTDEYVNMDDANAPTQTVIPGGVWRNADRTSRGSETDLVPTNVTTVGEVHQVIGYPRIADRLAEVVNTDEIINAVNRRGRRTALRIP